MRKLNVLVYDYISEETLDFLKESFEVTVQKYTKSVNRDEVDLILFHNEESGDLHPDYYSEVVGSKTNIVKRYWEHYRTLLDHALYCDIPKLGIGNGAQFLNVNAGGSLIQHVTGHHKAHIIVDERYGTGYVAPSEHHQMMYPFELPSKKYKILATSKYFQSETYLNGKNEEVDLVRDFTEPEIVYFTNLQGGGLAVQGDPTRTKDASYREFIISLIKNLLEKTL